MRYKQVTQKHDSGCFIACVAMMLGISYNQALKRVHPNMRFEEWQNVALPPEEAIKKLPVLGINIKPSKQRRISRLRRDALLLIRWARTPWLQHAAIYDSSRRRMFDPAGKPFPRYIYESQLDTVLYIEKQKKPMRINAQ